jgi:hypothetical protein
MLTACIIFGVVIVSACFGSLWDMKRWEEEDE